MSREWVGYEPDEDAFAWGLPRLGSRVAVRGSHAGMEAEGLEDGHLGTVTGYGRGARADELFKENQYSALLAGRELTAEDYEPLIDSEGPVIRWDGKTEDDWIPGQAMGAFREVKEEQ